MNKEMKTYKWKVAAFVAWVVVTLIVVSVALRGVSKADTATNLISVAILLFWTLLSLATKYIERELGIGYESGEPLEHYVYGRFTKWKQKYLNYINGGEGIWLK